MEFIEHIKPDKRYLLAQEEDLNFNISLKTHFNDLNEYNNTRIISLSELFTKERNESTKYRIYGIINYLSFLTNKNTSTKNIADLFNDDYLTNGFNLEDFFDLRLYRLTPQQNYLNNTNNYVEKLTAITNDYICKLNYYGFSKNIYNEKNYSFLFNTTKINPYEEVLLDNDIIYDNKEVKSLIAENIPLDLKEDVYNHLIIEINSIKEIEKSSKEQLSGKIYEYFVGRDQSAISELGAYFTNRRIVDFILNKIKPEIKPDGNIPTMIDMFGGSGGFTIGYIDYLNKNNQEINWENQMKNVYHIDINEDVLKSARLEFFCLSNGIIPDEKNNIIRHNSFKKEFDNKFDLILTNPPYGGDKNTTSCKKAKRDKIITYIENEFSIFKKNLIQKLENDQDIKSKNKADQDKIKKIRNNGIFF